MKSILKELYNGNIYPEERIPRNPGYSIKNKRLSVMLETWKKKLDADDLIQLENILDIQSEIKDMEILNSFMQGFKLGALIMIEVASSIDEFSDNE